MAGRVGLKSACAIAGLLLSAALCARFSHAADQANRSSTVPALPLFLDVFRTPDERIVAEPVELNAGTGERGMLYRPKSDEQLPGLLLIAGGATPEFFVQTARELASIGYAVMVVSAAKAELETGRSESTTALMREAARQLKSRKDVFADKIGVLGWGPAANCALKVASAEAVQAVVLVDLDIPTTIDDRLLTGLKRTDVLIVQGNPTARDRLDQRLAAGQVAHQVWKAAGAKPGFMDPRSGRAFDLKAADHAWFEIYEFVGKFVEDAGSKTTLASRNSATGSSAQFASIADAMRKANGPTGARTALARTLNDGPRDERDWKVLREESRVLADCGAWLVNQTPRKGDAADWRRHAASYRDAANALANAAERKSDTDAQSALTRLNASCARCHAEHRQ
jgi:dienelactone hydrolase